MYNTTQVLFVSASNADETVLTTLLADRDSNGLVKVVAAATPQAFYDAVHSEQSFHIIVVDERQSWSDWRSIVAICAKHRPNALLVLLVAVEQRDAYEDALSEGIAAIYPRSSAGIIALARLASKIGTQERVFSLRQETPADDAKAETRDEDRQRLVYAVSHDLQDPLQLARRYADILNEDYDEELGESGAKVLGHLQFNLGRTQEMLDELLDYSRLETAAPEREPVDFNALLDEVIAMYKLPLEEIGGSITRQHDLPTLVVDRRQFLRVFQNLVGNAMKFRSERPLQISVRAQQVRNEWRIGIKDNGIGIAEDDVRRIFGMFERGANADDFPGTGMGLAICKRIVQNHGGRIWVRSSPGSGSVFIFSVPQVQGAPAAAAGSG